MRCHGEGKRRQNRRSAISQRRQEAVAKPIAILRGDRGFGSFSLQRRVQCEPDFLPLNSRYFRPVRRKETRARRWDLQFESTSLQRGVHCEPDILCSDPDAVLNHTPVRKLVAVRLTQSNFDWIKAVARYAGLTGSSEESGAKRREQGLARAGNARARRRMIQLAGASCCFRKERTGTVVPGPLCR
jgi:hypothetical protein